MCATPGPPLGSCPTSEAYSASCRWSSLRLSSFTFGNSPGRRLLRLAFGLQLGRWGNLIDRLARGYVTDFIDVRVWPIFNVADSAIVVGTILLAYYALFVEPSTQRAEGDPGAVRRWRIRLRPGRRPDSQREPVMPLLELTVEEPRGASTGTCRALPLTRSAVQRLIDEGRCSSTAALHGPAIARSLAMRCRCASPNLNPTASARTPAAERPPMRMSTRWSSINQRAWSCTREPGASGTLVNALLGLPAGHCARRPDPQRPGIVHRLDRETSGLLVVAAHREAQAAAQAMFKRREVHKGYLALVVGVLTPERGAIEAPIGRDPIHRRRMAVLAEGGRFRSHGVRRAW